MRTPAAVSHGFVRVLQGDLVRPDGAAHSRCLTERPSERCPGRDHPPQCRSARHRAGSTVRSWQGPQQDSGEGPARDGSERSASRGLRLLALLGFRKGEILALPWSAVDLNAGTLRVEQTLQRVAGELRINIPKTRRSKRVVPLPDFCITALEERRKIQAEERAEAGSEWEDTGLIFTTSSGRPIDPRNLLRHFYAVRKRAGLETYRFHDIRHTAVSLLLDLGVPPHVVREIVGHSAIEVTMDVYAHASLEEKTKRSSGSGKRSLSGLMCPLM
ncbi:site-specific integrase [Sphaerisporangium sp. NBC_01403]|uniref:site-specific integrase n=1 Tax=Sphaerisporangium sp. NBC_01403 TaxID=2903599 RepID=UPI00386D619F